VLLDPVVCNVVDSSLVPAPPPRLGCRLDVLRLDTSVSEKVVNNPREATSSGSRSVHDF
jgi:hypothetical protein